MHALPQQTASAETTSRGGAGLAARQHVTTARTPSRTIPDTPLLIQNRPDRRGPHIVETREQLPFR